MAPKEQPLRFAVGSRVECNTGQWMAGTVVGHWWRDPNWPASKKVPYQIKLDQGPTIFAPMDDDRCIRKVQGLLEGGRIPVTVFTGFLGAGKTTLLNYILTAQHGKKYAIIENEFGDAAIDTALIDANVGKKDTVESITTLDNGCLCCTVRDDLVGAIKGIVETMEKRFKEVGPTAKLDGILIETTGMADPGPIINTFGKDADVVKYCKIDGIITVVDCAHFLQQLTRERPAEAVNEPAQQVGFADKVLLNKVDTCERAKIEETKAAIRGINAFVPIRECQLAKKPDEVPIGELLAIEAFDAAKLLTEQASNTEVNLVVKDPEAEEEHGGGHGHGGGHEGGHSEGHGGHGEGHGHGHEEGHGSGHGDCAEDCTEHGSGGHDTNQGHGHGHAAKPRHDTDVRSMVLEAEVLDMHRFHEFLGGILEERAQDLYRYKGVLAVRDERDSAKVCLHILQGVHDMPEITFSGEWPKEKPVKTQVVLIGRKLDTAKYRAEFDSCKAK
eukprot:SRR837773.98.p1 GENE.SRR837773.98~~SRR837773.98.p1  ORF type:complete len:500 (+),score=188.32 SRR837773.98:3-1502(+)